MFLIQSEHAVCQNEMDLSITRSNLLVLGQRAAGGNEAFGNVTRPGIEQVVCVVLTLWFAGIISGWKEGTWIISKAPTWYSGLTTRMYWRPPGGPAVIIVVAISGCVRVAMRCFMPNGPRGYTVAPLAGSEGIENGLKTIKTPIFP